MLPDKKIRCPHTGFKRTCRSIVAAHTCPKFVRVLGTSKNTGKEIDHWGCVDTIMPELLIANTKMQCETGAAVESFRNELVQTQRAQNATVAGMVALFEQRDGAPLQVAGQAGAALRMITNGEGGS